MGTVVCRKKRGLSLLETVIGLFLMVLLMLGSLRLFDAGLYYSSQAQQSVTAVRVAQNVLQEIRIWARTPTAGGLEWDDWSYWDGYDAMDATESGYRVRVSVVDRELKSPSAEMEESFPLGEQKILADSCKTVEILVSWSDDSKEYTLTSLVSEPARPLPITVEVTPVGALAALNRDATADFRVRALDADGVVIDDLFFEWNVKPSTTNGGITQTRSGETSTFIHAVAVPNLPTLYTQGNCVVEASTIYHGRPAKGESDPFVLNP